VHQIFGIVDSQIETNCVFSIINVLIALKCYWLGLQNIEHLVMLIKNWSNNPHHGCMNFKHQTIEEFVGLEGNLYETLDDEFE
jgi:hypothetical protein